MAFTMSRPAAGNVTFSCAMTGIGYTDWNYSIASYLTPIPSPTLTYLIRDFTRDTNHGRDHSLSWIP